MLIPEASSNIAEELIEQCQIAFRVEDSSLIDAPIYNITTYGIESFLVLGTENTALIGERNFKVVAYYANFPEEQTFTTSFNVTVNLILGDKPGILAEINSKPEFKLPP